jgi:2,4-dichlorophenol 6-monooxygenase
MLKGRVAIAGDAAHRHPPANGLGSNTSVQDAFNLAWKLAMVVRRQAAPALLRTYSEERQPVARQVVERAMKSVLDMHPIARALGFREGQDAQEGWASLKTLFSDSDAGRSRRKALAAAIESQNQQFNCHGVELGQRYTSAAIVRDGVRFPVPNRDPDLYFQPTTTPGASLPHAWVEREGKLASTLDLVGGGAFTVITGLGGQGWLEAAKQLARQFGVEVRGVLIGHGCDIVDVYGQWAELREIDENGCLLIRPDRFVAYRACTLIANPVDDLRHALTRILGRGPPVGRARFMRPVAVEQ